MHRRVTLATSVLAIAVLAGCGSDGEAGEVTSPTTTPTATLSEAPPVDADDPAAVALWGDWQIPSEDYVLHLVEDGTFLEDYMGVTDFRTGKFRVEGDTLTLVGDDGNNDDAKIVGDSLEFTLGTATRVE
ncbi:MAG: hypothetical protein ABW075_12545 [Aeromicrobium sp.]